MPQKESIRFSNGKYRDSSERLQPYKLELLNLVNRNNRGRILDIGCGSGEVSLKLHKAGWRVFGLDVSEVGIRKYRGRGFDGVFSDAEQGLPFKADTFDGIWISEVIEHLVDYKKLLVDINRVLKPSGKLFITTPNSMFYGYRLLYLLGRCPTELQHPFHVRFFSLNYLTRILVECGLSPQQCIGQNIYLMVPGSLVRWGRRRVPKLTDKLLKLMDITRIPGLIHGDKYVLYRCSSFFPGFFSNAMMLVAEKE